MVMAGVANSDGIVVPIVRNTRDWQEGDAVPNRLFATLAHLQMSRHIPNTVSNGKNRWWQL
jgi:hypothetical protein